MLHHAAVLPVGGAVVVSGADRDAGSLAAVELPAHTADLSVAWPVELPGCPDHIAGAGRVRCGPEAAAGHVVARRANALEHALAGASLEGRRRVVAGVRR